MGGSKRRARRDDGEVVIDDTLATTALWGMTPEEILGDEADPEGDRIGEEVAAAVRAQLPASGELPPERTRRRRSA